MKIEKISIKDGENACRLLLYLMKKHPILPNNTKELLEELKIVAKETDGSAESLEELVLKLTDILFVDAIKTRE